MFNGLLSCIIDLNFFSSNSNDLMEREFTDFDVEVEARAFDEFAEFEARDLFEQLSELDARDYDEIDAREYEEVYNYLRAVSSSVSTTASATSTASSAKKTVTKTKTIVPKPTSCTQSELRVKKLTKKIAHEKAKQAKKAKKAAVRAKKLLAKKQAKNAKKGKHTTTTSSSTSATPTASSSTTPALKVIGTQLVAAAQITAAPSTKAVAHKYSRATVTGKHGTVTVHLTTTAARPACTRAGKFKKLFKHKQARDFEEDDLFV